MTKPVVRAIALALLCMTGLSQLPSSAAPFDTVESLSDKSLTSYQKVYIAPVTIQLKERSPKHNTLRRRNSSNRDQRLVSQDTQNLKASELHADLKRSFAEKFTLVDAPANDVLTVETEITRLIPSRPTLAERREGVISVNPAGSISAGGASYNVVISVADNPIYNIQEKYKSSLSDNIVRVGIWQDTDRSFDQFSKQLARFVSKN